VSPAILPLGDPRLRRVCTPVTDFQDPALRAEADQLCATLEAFRRQQGFGRGVAAPQIGIPRRFVALNLGEGPVVLVNPVITGRSADTFTLWDDCMCFPGLLVRVRRHDSVSVSWQDLSGLPRTWTDLPRATSELLQHELDHLDGILALDRAEGPEPIISREAFQADPSRFAAQVDHIIQPTL
jgi:peptide deformylase